MKMILTYVEHAIPQERALSPWVQLAMLCRFLSLLFCLLSYEAKWIMTRNNSTSRKSRSTHGACGEHLVLGELLRKGIEAYLAQGRMQKGWDILVRFPDEKWKNAR